ncbi:hypothetical protein PAECIP111893_00025 [Paenibacillus plantiphilus]|uniref:Uncharacterized protein n=1 Tax=Paenibacillus plantiphilus TaxID=2905650 RepID=A0ABM9BL60_9BACL|nr:hypothetical protein [Paenibacillus plantiphilus]CAH1189927.1 hypothetical protein PAECIP111893_00025 [Paenibacillus plantiphilus]
MSLATILFGPNRWKTILAANAHGTDELQDKYEYLQHKGVKSRLRVEEDHSLFAVLAIDYRSSRQRNRSMALLVHEEDLSRAVEALNKYESLRYAAQTPVR